MCDPASVSHKRNHTFISYIVRAQRFGGCDFIIFFSVKMHLKKKLYYSIVETNNIGYYNKEDTTIYIVKMCSYETSWNIKSMGPL